MSYYWVLFSRSSIIACLKLYFQVGSNIPIFHLNSSIPIHKMQSAKKVPVFLFFLDFAGNLRARKPNKAQKKRVNITGIQYFCGLGSFSRINMSGVNFFSPLSSLHFNSSQFAPTPLFSSFRWTRF